MDDCILDLILIRKDELFTTTLAIAEGANIEHEHVVRLLKKYSYLEDLSRVENGEVRTKGRPIKIAYLTELQATLLIVLMKNSPEVIAFKTKLTKAFFKQRKMLQQLLIQKNNQDWIEKRQETKVMRRELTDMIQKFVLYAESQGSKSAPKYYMNISKMELTGLFLMEQKYPNARDVMSFRQLNLIEMADEAIARALDEAMNLGMHYKECYKFAKDRIELLAKIFPPSPLPLLLSGNL